MTPQPTRTRRPDRADLDRPRRHGEPTPRVLMKPVAPKSGYVDGAWWPYTDNLVAELPGLLTVLAARLRPVIQVAYHLVEWTTPAGELVVDDRSVRLDWHGHAAAHTVALLGPLNRRLVLLVVPPDTDPGDAYTAMTAAASANNSSTADDLLQIGIRQRRARKQRAAAVRRWAARTTSPN
ncbi:DUF5994 family protein [Nocardia huaxiensis]|uniref:Uncharacterized protein n=1 Tax=Nocardia huaxiensis TaxID=2755382 RepID=A0A7D6V948_9NOCA|nr:DUF5994 family protein [Nocardia huaxiensis]QLY29251.1 hypothetical protein H0264_28790 [Nocardia huaxiensis]UFS97247.1 DUF5994 family protein [Nocardia huaxiensis]